MEFRKDINGLRAYAVIAVLLYHFGVGGFSGGYAGVDVFFVISGYLMTGIILGGMTAGRFSLSGFYLGRARRILPALIALSIALLLFGWFWLIPDTYKVLADNAAASLLFVSNFFYMSVDYFDAPAHENWLLHTWSLSVEWQFYLFYPMVLLLVARWFGDSRRHLHMAMWLMLLASLAACVVITGSKPLYAFYLLPLRGWELLAGGLVSVYANRLVLPPGMKSAMEWAGLAAILASFVVFDPSTAWPGHAALLPVAGTCLVILAGRQDSAWTGNALAQAIGKWSYSIYLWHWPLVVGLAYFGLKENTGWLESAMALSVVLGAVSYGLVEQPARKAIQGWPGNTGWRPVAATVAVPVLLAAWVIVDKGIPHEYRLSPQVLVAAHERVNTSHLSAQCKKTKNVERLPECVLGGSDVKAVVLGDSHAGATVTAVVEAARKAGGGVRLFLRPGCLTLAGDKDGQNETCRKFNELAFASLGRIDSRVPVIVINRTTAYIKQPKRPSLINIDANAAEQVGAGHPDRAAQLVESLCRIAATRPVYMVKPIPDMRTDVPTVMARALMLTGQADDISLGLAEHRQFNGMAITAIEQAGRQCGVHMLDPVPYLCPDGTCYGSIKGRPLYSDTNHLSEYGNRFLVPMFEQVFRGD